MIRANFRFGLCVFVFGLSVPGYAANYPLELTNIKPAGTLPTGLNSANRIYRAYPGIPYNIRAAVMGGAYPFVYSLQNSPAGMTINADTGEINWPNPQSNASPTIIVRDTENSQVSATWTINVSANGFQFLDANNGRTIANGGTGTLANPWRTLADMFQGGAAGAVTYFRAGTYTPAGLPVQGVPQVPTDNPEARVEFDEAAQSVIWIAYPGDARPVIDYGYIPGTLTTPRFRLSGTNVYIDGLETTRSHIMAFQIGYSGAYQGSTIRRCVLHHGGDGPDGSNGSFIMTIQTAGGPFNRGMFVADNEFHTSPSDAVKTYDQDRVLIADNVIRGNFQTNNDGGIAIKGAHGRWEVRGNRIYDWFGSGIGGNMNGAQNGEIRFNLIIDNEIRRDNLSNPDPNLQMGPRALILNYHGTAGPIYVYRNTVVGRIQFRFLEPTNGPFHVSNNVILNVDDNKTPPYFYYGLEGNGAADPSRAILTNNLTGTPTSGIVDANGNLQGTYRTQFLGTRGYELGTGSPLPPISPCDLNSSRSTDVTDVQLCANQVIGTTACSSCNIDSTPGCSVTDVQRVVNAVFGGECVTQ